MMNISPIGGSAKIYEFPRGGRAGLAKAREMSNFEANLAILRAMPVASGGSWYHEEAIRADEPTNKRS